MTIDDLRACLRHHLRVTSPGRVLLTRHPDRGLALAATFETEHAYQEALVLVQRLMELRDTEEV